MINVCANDTIDELWSMIDKEEVVSVEVPRIGRAHRESEPNVAVVQRYRRRRRQRQRQAPEMGTQSESESFLLTRGSSDSGSYQWLQRRQNPLLYIVLCLLYINSLVIVVSCNNSDIDNRLRSDSLNNINSYRNESSDAAASDDFPSSPDGHRHFTPTWAVHIPGGETVANLVAAEHGFTNYGKVRRIYRMALFDNDRVEVNR